MIETAILLITISIFLEWLCIGTIFIAVIREKNRQKETFSKLEKTLTSLTQQTKNYVDPVSYVNFKFPNDKN